MITAFCPAHITCFFQPADGIDVLSKGSRGVGMRLDRGASVSVSENRSGHTDVTMDGRPSDAPITRKVIETALPGRGFDVTVINDLPTGQGFGMSAAGAIAVALCLTELSDISVTRAYELAHAAEVLLGGGLGDVSAIMANVSQPVRIKAGLPPRGEVIGTDADLGRLSVAVLGPKVSTSNVLGDPDRNRMIREAGGRAVDDYLKGPTKERLYSISNSFSSETGLEGPDMEKAIGLLRENGIMSSMCMLGNSIFADCSADRLSDMLALSASDVIPSDRPARITQKA
ncbi:MAG: pantoate kinase [Candidatus Methanomethylophilaceae archaeon]